jgi:hypothetical protein
MDKLATKEAIMSQISEELDLWLEKADNSKDGYEYETELLNTTRTINQIILSNSLGEVSSDRKKKKKNSDLFWEV